MRSWVASRSRTTRTSVGSKPQRALRAFCMASISAAVPSSWLFLSKTGSAKRPTATSRATFRAAASPPASRPTSNTAIETALALRLLVAFKGLVVDICMHPWVRSRLGLGGPLVWPMMRPPTARNPAQLPWRDTYAMFDVGKELPEHLADPLLPSSNIKMTQTGPFRSPGPQGHRAAAHRQWVWLGCMVLLAARHPVFAQSDDLFLAHGNLEKSKAGQPRP